MKYLSRAIRDEIAEHLIAEHNDFIRFRDKQSPHPPGAVDIKRAVAENRIKRLRELIATLAPHKLKT